MNIQYSSLKEVKVHISHPLYVIYLILSEVCRKLLFFLASWNLIMKCSLSLVLWALSICNHMFFNSKDCSWIVSLMTSCLITQLLDLLKWYSNFSFCFSSLTFCPAFWEAFSTLPSYLPIKVLISAIVRLMSLSSFLCSLFFFQSVLFFFHRCNTCIFFLFLKITEWYIFEVSLSCQVSPPPPPPPLTYFGFIFRGRCFLHWAFNPWLSSHDQERH